MLPIYQPNLPIIKSIGSIQSTRFYDSNFISANLQLLDQNSSHKLININEFKQQLYNSNLSDTYFGFNLATHVNDDFERVTYFRQLLEKYFQANNAIVNQNQINIDINQLTNNSAKANPLKIHWLNQIHGNIVHYASSNNHLLNIDADAVWTNEPGQICPVMTADCLPILVQASDGSCVAAIHAGWKSLVTGIIENTILAMREKYPNVNFQAWLGPAISSKCFIVGSEVVEMFLEKNILTKSTFLQIEKSDKFLANLHQLAKISLNDLGVKEIFGAEDCTFSQPNRYYSYRRDKNCGRMLSAIYLKYC